MESENQLQIENLVDSLGDQVGILFGIVSRPVVLRQILVVLLIALLTWALSRLIERWRARAQPSSQTEVVDRASSVRALTGVLKELLAPLSALVLLNISIWIFGQLDYPKGLLEKLINLILLWLVYRAVVTLLHVRFGSDARPYRNRIVTPLFLILVVVQMLPTWPGDLPLIKATVNIGTISFSFANLVTALTVLYLFIISAWLVQTLMVRALPDRLNAETGLVESVATLTRYLILAIGIIVSLGLLGLDFTSLAIIAGGLSVGIGIGLQDIVSNFVSGLVLMFEQSMRPGDVIEFDDRITQVEKISLRATTVRTRTNEELIIPNASFTTQQVKNLTKSDRLVRVVVPLGVSYSSDPAMVRDLSVETSLKHPQVLAEPAPQLMFLAYGESSLDFNLVVSVDQPELSLKIRSDLYYMLWQVFAEHDITIPFPQRDLNLGDGWEKLTTAKSDRA